MLPWLAISPGSGSCRYGRSRPRGPRTPNGGLVFGGSVRAHASVQAAPDTTIVPTARLRAGLPFGSRCRSHGPSARTFGTPNHSNRRRPGEFMVATAAAPSREDFAQLLEESFNKGNLQEGSVIKGIIVGIEKDLAVIDVGLKTEGRVPVREFAAPGRQSELKVGDTVEVYLERVENALGEAVLSRDKARREESWGKLEQAFQGNEKVQGVIFNQVNIRPIRDVTPLMNVSQPFQILKMDRRRGNIVVSRRTVLEETRAEQRQELVQNLEEGQVIDGVVKNITDYGAFVDLGGIDG